MYPLPLFFLKQYEMRNGSDDLPLAN